jgi:O-antigen/teichoic acid export membrane protein
MSAVMGTEERIPVAPPAGGDLLDSSAAGAAAIRGGTLRVAGYAAGVALSVGSAAVLFRHLGVVDSGRYVLVLSLVTLAAGLTDAGLTWLGVREVALRRGDERRALLSNLLGLRLVFSLLGVLVACGYSVAAGYPRSLVLGTAIAGAATTAMNLQSTLSTVLMAELRLGWVTALELLRQVVFVVGVIALVQLGATLVPFFALAAGAAAGALLATAILVRRGIPFRPAFDRAQWRGLLAETLPYALAAAVGAVYFRLAILIVNLVASDTQTGYFGVSFRIIEVLVLVPQLVVGAGFPIFARAARDDAARLRYGLQKMLDACLILGTITVVALGVGAPVAIDVVAGPKFDAAAAVLRLHAVALLGSFLSAVFGYALLSLRRRRAVVGVNAAALATIAVLGPVLASTSGARGAAGATIAAEAVLAVSGWALLARGPEGIRLGLPGLPRVSLAAGLAVLPALVLPAAPATAAALVVLLAALVALRAVPEEVMVEVRRVLRLDAA